MDEASAIGSLVAWQQSEEGTEGTDRAISAAGRHLFAMPEKLALKLSDIENPGDVDDDSDLFGVDQSKALQDENVRLRKLLAERDFDLSILKKKWQEERLACSAGGFMASDVAGAKIVELSRRVRDITAELEREKTKTKQLLKALQNAESNPSQSKQDEHVLRKMDDQTSVHNCSEESTSLQEKLQVANNRLTEYRNLCFTLKRDLKVAQKALLLEVGDETLMKNALSESRGWKGRAQQICSLQNKVMELKAQLEQHPALAGNCSEGGSLLQGTVGGGGEGVDNRQREQLRKLEKERREEHEKTQMNLQELKTQYEQMKGKLEGTKARSKILHSENQALKAKVATLVAKGEHDDELIATLTEQLSRMQESLSEHQRMESLARDNLTAEVESVQAQLGEDVVRLRAIVKDREERLQQVEKELNQLKDQNTVQSAGYRNNYKGEATSMTHGPNSAPLLRPMGESLGRNTCKRLAWRSADSAFPSASDLNDKDPSIDEERNEELHERSEASSELEEIKLMCQEYRLVAQATQVEKEKLLELVTVMNKRLETAASHALQAEQRVLELQQKNVQLEKQLERANLDLHPRPGGAHRKESKSLPFMSFSTDRTSDDHKRSVDALKEENATLRHALEEMVRAKEEDLRIYQDIIERTRLAFTDGLRQLRS